MKLLRSLLGLTILSSLSVVGFAQTATVGNPEALVTLQRDLREASEAMGPCMPIYQGHCGNSKNAVQGARHIVDALLAPPKPAVIVQSTIKSTVTPEKPKVNEKPKQMQEAPKTSVVSKPILKEIVVAKVESKEELEKKIAASHANLRRGLEAIQKALKDLKATAGAMPEDQKTTVEKFLVTAEAEAKKGLELHTSKA